MRELDRGLTEEERYWHGWPWALCLAAFVYVSYCTTQWGLDRRWGYVAMGCATGLYLTGLAGRSKKKYYLRRNNAQARQRVEF